MAEVPIVNNTERHQFELRDGEHTSRLVYRIDGDVIDLLHTEVPKALAGRGIANELARAALEFAAINDLLVRPTCPFVRAYLRRHPTAAKLTGRRDD